MTPDMQFECLLVTRDPVTFSTLDRMLQDFSIHTNVCPNPSRAAGLLADGNADLLVIDLEGEHSLELVHQVCKSRVRQKPTILAVSAVDCAVPGVHIVLRKPVTPESGAKSLRAAYSRMLLDYRKHTRFALMTPVLATDETNRTISMTVANIGSGGVGIVTKEKLAIGNILSFQLRLPGLKGEIHLQARVLWIRPYGAAGCQFTRLPPADLQVLHAWFESRYRFRRL